MVKKNRQQKRAEKRGVTLKRDPSALDLLSAHMFRMEIVHAEFTQAEIASALDGGQAKGYRITIEGNDQEAPALLAVHMRQLGISRIAFSNAELNNLTPGHKTIIDGDEEMLRITLVPNEIADMAADLPNFREKGRGEPKKR